MFMFLANIPFIESNRPASSISSSSSSSESSSSRSNTKSEVEVETDKAKQTSTKAGNNKITQTMNTSRPPLPSNHTHRDSNHSGNSSSLSTNASKKQQQQQFHRRQNTKKSSIPSLPKPSHINKPATTSSYFYKYGDVKSQDVFAEAFKKRNSKLRVLFPGMDRFEYERVDVWNHDNICTPCLIVQPKSNREVRDALQAYIYGVKTCLAINKDPNHPIKQTLNIPRLTIASGRNSIHAMQDGCVVLDMSNMRQIKVYPNTKECKIQGGVRVIDLDATLADYGLVAISSIFQNMGVVGCILSGGCGFGYASRKFGLACDNVLEAEIVLADGRLKTCSRERNPDLFYNLCGGGGGIGVVVSVTLQCYPLLHAALLTYQIPSYFNKNEGFAQGRKTVLSHWANWVHGDIDSSNLRDKLVPSSSSLSSSSSGEQDGKNKDRNKENTKTLQQHDGVDNNVFSQIIIPTKQSSSIQFLATSIDDKAIPQMNGFLEQYEEAERKARRGTRVSLSLIPRWMTSNNDSNNNNKYGGGSGSNNSNYTESSFKQYKSASQQMQQYGWDKTPGLSTLINDKFGAPTRTHVQFRMVRYADQLQSHSNEYFTSGNMYVATKYAASLTSKIIDILVQATIGDISPSNESKIYIHTLGGETRSVKDLYSMAYNARHMKYVIFIEGRWEDMAPRKLAREKEKVIAWVNWVVNKLNKAEGVQSTAHPETQRDQVSSSGKKPPKGWYNFDENSGKKLNAIKQKRDPKNVFSLASKVKWSQGTDFHKDAEAASKVSHATINPSGMTQKTMQKLDLRETTIDNLISDDSDHIPDSFDDHDENEKYAVTSNNDGDDEKSMQEDIKRLFSITDENDPKDWSFNESTLGRADFDAIGNGKKDDSSYCF